METLFFFMVTLAGIAAACWAGSWLLTEKYDDDLPECYRNSNPDQNKEE